MAKEEERLTGTAEWRGLFSNSALDQAEELLEHGEWDYFYWDENIAKARVRAVPGRGRWNEVYINHIPRSYSDQWKSRGFLCSCGARRKSYFYYEPETCVHQAALLLKVESEHGKWIFTETEKEMDERLKIEWLKKTKETREQQREKEEVILVRVSDVLPEYKAGTSLPYFDLRKIFSGVWTNLYYQNRMKDILKNGRAEDALEEIRYGQRGEQIFYGSADIFDGLEREHAEIAFSYHSLVSHDCSCSPYSYFRELDDPLCEHELVLLRKMWNYIQENNPGDATDLAAESFFQMLDQSDIVLEEETSAAEEKEKVISIFPRITMEDGQPKLSFKIGLGHGKPLVLKKLSEFASAVEHETCFALGTKTEIDFSIMEVTEESEPWLIFIQRRVRETQSVNDRLYSKNYYGRAASLSVQSQEILTGSTLDRFYDLAEGKECEYQSKVLGIHGKIRVGHTDMNVHLETAQITDAAGAFVGIAVTGMMPVILEGVSDNYILDEKHLSRISKEEHQALAPFRKAASKSGEIHFQVGKARLSEFYYRAVPSLLESKYVDFEDDCAEAVAEYLPPEPEFLFQLDVEGGLCICQASVSYRSSGEVSKALLEAFAEEKERKAEMYPADGYRDELQEERVVSAIREFFPRYNPDRKGFESLGEFPEEELYGILTEGIPLLNRYGEVKGTEAFRMNSVRPVPQVRVGVSIESGIMDISILSKDITPEELLKVLSSYRRKKKYYRLKGGDFIDISGDAQLASLDDMMTALDLSSEDVMRGNVKLPAFRALYLDKMLEAHDDLVADRNKTYRKLVKNFHTIRDADYEPAAGMEEVLRPYQMYGYKWMRTIAAVGFGGILADEMGLGKTLQTIALIAALFEEGEQKPCLIVCPASLVFNWQEEFYRFAPKLSVCPVVGTVADRKQIFEEMEKASGVQVYITSYDLLRKDIVQYEAMTFSVMVLDEAQYIKNQKAAMTKAVKVVKAEHRFALTGTPIENRLAELWSIFDFLMPGFLYKYDEFSEKFEVPVTKEKNQEKADRLKQMVGPFILRRLKTDVLKDLPPKLEEVRYARFEDEQRKVYDGQVVRMKQMISGAENDRIRMFAELTRIRQICCDPSLFLEYYHGGSAKRQACIELVKSAIEGGHKILLFSQFTSMLALLEEDLNKEGIVFYKLTGSTPKGKRVRMVRDFNENEVPVFLISLKAGGTGLNLTGADVVIHYDPWWNVAAQNQATDRAHRIGQKNQVTVYRLIVKDTIEEKILALQEAKKDLADAILSGESESIYTLSGEELLELL